MGSYSEDEYWGGMLFITELNYRPDLLPSDYGSENSNSANSDSSYTLDDWDEDGISDDLELYLAESFMPVFEFDEEEHNPLRETNGIRQQDDVVFLYQVSEVKCGVNAVSGVGTRFYLEPLDTNTNLPSWIENSTSYLLTIVAAYEYDYLPLDPGPGEEDRFNHYGDTERVRICILLEDDTYRARFLFINRHHEMGMYVTSDIPEWEGSHPYLYVSEGKHATFVSERECRGSVAASDMISFLVEPSQWSWSEFKNSLQWTGFREDCGGGRVMRPTVYADYNVGEYVWLAEVSMHDLAPELPDNEMVWSYYSSGTFAREHYFCGGYEVEDYDGTHSVAIGYSSPICAGPLATKWWPPADDR